MAKKLTKDDAARFLAGAPTEKSFYPYYGGVIGTIEGLYGEIEKMSDEQFNYHRNDSKNDFYNWIINVIGDNRLANDLARAKTKETTLKKIKSRIDFLKSVK